MHLMHQLQMTAALIHYLILFFSCQREQRRQEYCCQTDFLFKTWQKKSRIKKEKRRTTILVWCSHRVQESHVSGFLSENVGLFSRCTPCFPFLLQGDSGGTQTNRHSYPFLMGKSEDPYNSDTFSLNTLPFNSGLDWN